MPTENCQAFSKLMLVNPKYKSTGPITNGLKPLVQLFERDVASIATALSGM